MSLYVQTPFKNKINILSESAVANMQLKRVDNVNFKDEFTYVSSYEEAVSKAK